MSLVYGSSSYSIPFENINGLMLIEGDFDGQKGRFIFDTGADEILLHSDRVQSDQSVFQTVGDNLLAEKGEINYLTLGNYREEDVTVYKTDLQSLQDYTSTPVAGIVGLSMFDVEVLHIDNVNNTIQLYTLDQINMVSDRKFVRNRMSTYDGLPILNVTIGNTDYNFAMDSGATTSFVCETVMMSQVKEFDRLDSSFRVSTAAGETDSHYYSCDAITLGKLKIKDLRFGTSDLTQVEGISGILSLDSLPSEEIIFDFVTGHIYMSI